MIQFVSSHWRGTARDKKGEQSFYARDPLQINPGFFQRLDKRVAMINEFGFVAALVVLWSYTVSDPGHDLSEEDAIRLASYIVARYDAYSVVWLLGGDGNYQQMGTGRWKQIGRRVFNHGHHCLASLHPCGLNWVAEEFHRENWYSFIGYQSGHGDSVEDLRWMVKGPPATAWTNLPALPVINLEPNYETAYGFQHNTVFTDFHVRRAAYWSLLVHPSAGFTYGHDAIWNWNSETGPSEGHGDWHGGAVPPWHTGLDTPGTRSMTLLRDIFNRLDWSTMEPYQSLLADQPGDRDVKAFIAAGRNAQGRVVVYSPLGKPVVIAGDTEVPGPVSIVDPRTGEIVRTTESVGNRINFPDNQDWLAICGDG
jgi:hypothetical protein